MSTRWPKPWTGRVARAAIESRLRKHLAARGVPPAEWPGDCKEEGVMAVVLLGCRATPAVDTHGARRFLDGRQSARAATRSGIGGTGDASRCTRPPR